MDRFINTPELIQLVAFELVQRRDKLALALTCQQFLEPGLYSLWYSVIPAKSINSTLPSDVSKKTKAYSARAGITPRVLVCALCLERHDYP
jgi:hypothetical protein